MPIMHLFNNLSYLFLFGGTNCVVLLMEFFRATNEQTACFLKKKKLGAFLINAVPLSTLVSVEVSTCAYSLLASILIARTEFSLFTITIPHTSHALKGQLL